jgi:hypothetical protein
MLVSPTRRHALAILAAGALLTATASLASATESAAATFVQSLYALPGLWGDVSADDASRARYLDANLAALVAENYAKEDIESALDYDPLIQAQDFDDLETTVTVDAENDTTATVTVVVDNFGERTFVHLDLAMTADGWRLSDIRASDNSSLVEELEKLNAEN